MKTLTTEWLKENNVCSSGMRWFLSQAETDASKVMIKLVKEDRFNDAFWLFKKIANFNQLCSFALFSAEQVLPIYEDYKEAIAAPRKAIAAAKAVLSDPSSHKNKRAAAAAAKAAADASAAAAAYTAADAAAYAAAHAAYTAAYAAADAAADAAAAAAAYDAAKAAAYAAAAAAYDAARKKMNTKIITYAIEVCGL